MTYQLEASVTREIVNLCRSVGEDGVSQIGMDMSLTRDLCFDSRKLIQFFSRVEQLYAGLALEKWFIEHRINGRDTIGNVVRYIADALPRAAGESPDGALREDQDPKSAQGPAGRPSRHGQPWAEACGQGPTGRS